MVSTACRHAAAFVGHRPRARTAKLQPVTLKLPPPMAVIAYSNTVLTSLMAVFLRVVERCLVQLTDVVRSATLLPFAGALLAGCSFLYDLGTNQCRVTSDCKALGAGFAGLVCEEGLCVEKSKPTPTPDNSSDGGTGGTTGPEPECTSHRQCIEENFNTPHLCREGSCVALETPECPVVLQPENLLVPEPIVIGAYSAINATDTMSSPITRSYNLVLNEFTRRVGGLPGGPNDSRRKLVAVVCEGASLKDAPLENSLSHLIDDVGVPAIVASLFPEDLREAFDARAKQDNIFFISPLNADSSLTSSNDGLLWFMLGAYSDLAPTFVPLVKRAEAHQRKALAEEEPTRVALVQGSLTPAQDVGQVLLSDPNHSLVFNGKTYLDNDASNKLTVELTSQFEDGEAEANAAISKLRAFRPHVIVVTAGSEFVRKVMPVLESTWDEADDGQAPPFYVLGPLLAFDDGFTLNAYSDVFDRVAGVNFATAEDRTLFNMYKENYQAAHLGDPFYEAENFYDAFYYMIYAIAAAGNPLELNGENIAAGMARLVAPVTSDRKPMPVGPNTISDVLAALAIPNSRINLQGTMGPADFNLGTGARVAKGSVWCVTPEPVFRYDVLRLDEETQELEGTFPCNSDF